MRALVGLLTRNVKVSGSKDSDWGCRVLVTQFSDVKKITKDKTRRGVAIIQGVEFEHCGQFDTDRGGLNFYYLTGPRI